MRHRTAGMSLTSPPSMLVIHCAVLRVSAAACAHLNALANQLRASQDPVALF